MLSDMPNVASITCNNTNTSAVSEGGILQDLQRQEMNARSITTSVQGTADVLAEMRATTEDN
jgi:hypothetical protein